ncbi:MAG: flavodoxin domain-containing protein [Dehalococcoidales bacterium]|nr:flavodoxin domain-containing protein [Dehalococcoidales bacterium]
MMIKVLMAYGSKYGATKEIAEKIGEALTGQGLQADVISAGKVKNVADYQAVIIGSAAYIGGWRKEVSNFVKKNEKVLAELPVWIFSSGPTEKGDPVKLLEGWLVPKGLKPVIDRIKPRDITVFHGMINQQKLNFMEKYMLKMVKTEIGDFRDWDMISKWAKGIAEAVKKGS